MTNIIKSKVTKVLVSHDGQDENEYTATVVEDAPNMVFIFADGSINGKKVSFELEMIKADVPYLIDLLKEFC